jgi:hypothetical protein
MESEDNKFASDKEEVFKYFCLLMDKFDPEQMQFTKIDEIKDGYIIYNGFSDEECQYLIKNIKYDQDVVFTNSNKEVYRKNLRTETDYPKLSEKIYNRIKHFLPQKYVIEEDVDEFGTFSKGEWEPSYLNPKIRICKYLNEGFFKPHYDGCYVINQHERSFFTLMFYLNEDYEGGETSFLTKDDLKTIFSIKPKKGMMIFFPQDIYHEGKAVVGEKYIFRTDIVFKRSNLNQTQEQLGNQELALKYFKLAQELERSKKGLEAVEYYKKAFKLDPDLEKVIK